MSARIAGHPLLTKRRVFGPGGISPGLKMWLISTQKAALDGSSWGDISGGALLVGNQVAQATPGNRPTYVASNPTFAGKPTYSLVSASETCFLGTYTAPLAQPLTIMQVMISTSGNVSQSIIDSNAGSRVTTYKNGAGVVDLSAGNQLELPQSASTLTCMISIANGLTSTIYWNYQNDAARVLVGDAGANAMPDITIGKNTVAPGFAWQGDLAEVAIWNRALTVGDVRSVMLYAANRYGVVVA